MYSNPYLLNLVVELSAIDCDQLVTHLQITIDSHVNGFVCDTPLVTFRSNSQISLRHKSDSYERGKKIPAGKLRLTSENLH